MQTGLLDTPAGIFESYPLLRELSFVDNFDFETCYTRTAGASFHELDVAVALLRTNSNIRLAAELLGRSRRATENFVTRNPKLTELFEDIEAAFLDDVESLHKTAALEGDLQTQRFFLTTKGKSRGYVTRAETTGAQGGPVEYEVRVQEDAERFIRGIAGLVARTGARAGATEDLDAD